MADDIQSNFDTYRVQLEQVEAALLAEPENESLLKLKIDLEEIIAISSELLDQNVQKGDKKNKASTLKEKDEAFLALNEGASDTSEQANKSSLKNSRKWQVGEKCMAVWSKNKQYFEAVIDGISEGKAVITFSGYNVTEINRLEQLKTLEEVPVKKYVWDANEDAGKPKQTFKSKSQWQVEKEKRKQKALKRIQKQRQIEEEKEKEKHRWKEFNRRALAKSFKGVKKESIFATNASRSRLGVGSSASRPPTKVQRSDRLSSITGMPKTTHAPSF